MKSALFLNASPMGQHSRGHALAQEALANLRQAHPGLTLVARDLAQGGFGAVSPDYAAAILSRAGHDTPAFHASEQLITELEASDALIIATPMHNYTVPAVLKLWIDLVLRAGRSFGFREGRKTGLLADRPTLVIVTSGGLLHGEAARQPDHLTGYLTDVLATIGITDLRFVYLEATANPELQPKSLTRARAVIAADPRFGALISAS